PRGNHAGGSRTVDKMGKAEQQAGDAETGARESDRAVTGEEADADTHARCGEGGKQDPAPSKKERAFSNAEPHAYVSRSLRGPRGLQYQHPAEQEDRQREGRGARDALDE